MNKELDAVALSIRSLSIDAIEKANSGHPGLPLGAAELAAALYAKILRHNPKNPQWVDRDRFILSAGHGSMLLYAALHLAGYDLSLDDIRSFRQIGSRCAGHPEYGLTPGVEATTGPLGQGISTAVGMAIAEAMLAARFNTEEYRIIDHYTYALVGEGCLMEGVSSEASSLAGTLKLGKLIVFYDKNNITIDRRCYKAVRGLRLAGAARVDVFLQRYRKTHCGGKKRSPPLAHHTRFGDRKGSTRR